MGSEMLLPSVQIVVSCNAMTEVHEITARLTSNPVYIMIEGDKLTLDGIRSFYVAIEREEWKLDTLMDLYETLTITQCVCYCRAEHVERIQKELQSRGVGVSALLPSLVQ